MIVFTVFRPGKYPMSLENPEAVFDLIYRNFGEEEAIEASSWCELAALEETFKGNGYTIEVEEI